jgi:hypothetical protein
MSYLVNNFELVIIASAIVILILTGIPSLTHVKPGKPVRRQGSTIIAALSIAGGISLAAYTIVTHGNYGYIIIAATLGAYGLFLISFSADLAANATPSEARVRVTKD